MERKKLAYFNCTGINAHIGCLGVTDSHLRDLLTRGYDIPYIFNTYETRFIRSADRRKSFDIAASSFVANAIDECDAVVINGEGTIHHHGGQDFLAISELAQVMDKPVFLVNCVIEEVENYDDVMKKMTDFTVRELRSSKYLQSKGISHRIVPDSIIDADFSDKADTDFSGKIICTDWHPQRDKDTGITMARYIERNSATENIEFFSFHHWRYIENENWRNTVANFKNAKCVVTGRHHGMYAAGLAGVPFVVLPSNTYKIEGTIELSGLDLPITTNIHELESKVKYAIDNPNLFKDFRHFLLKDKPLSTFSVLSDNIPTPKRKPEEVKAELTRINSWIYAKALKRETELYKRECRNRINAAVPNTLAPEPQLLNSMLMKKVTELTKKQDYKKIISLLTEHLYYYPSDHEALYHLGIARAYAGDLENGTRLFRHRSYIEQFRPKISLPAETEVFHGNAQSGKTLVWSTRGPGLGSEILYLSFLDKVAFNNEDLIITVDPRLLTTLRRSFPETDFRGYDDISNEEAAQIKYHTSISSLFALHFKYSGKNELPRKFPFLKIDENKRAQFCKRYNPSGKLLAGLSWHTTNPNNTHIRSLPDEAVLLLTQKSGIKFYSLQHGAEDMAIRNNHNINFDAEVDPVTDIEALIHQISAMDVVITIDNSVAYIAGALGIPTFLLVPDDFGWTWKLHKQHNYFFPCIRMLEKAKDESWESVIKRLLPLLNKSDIAKKGDIEQPSKANKTKLEKAG